MDADIRDTIGIALEPDAVRERVVGAAERMIRDRDEWEETIERVRKERLYHFGESGKYGGKYLIERMKGN